MARQGGSGIDLKHMRIPGILQRIAWAYCVVAMAMGRRVI
jgi:hypothetical protein